MGHLEASAAAAGLASLALISLDVSGVSANAQLNRLNWHLMAIVSSQFELPFGSFSNHTRKAANSQIAFQSIASLYRLLIADCSGIIFDHFTHIETTPLNRVAATTPVNRVAEGTQISGDIPLISAGLDSLMTTELITQLKIEWHLELPATIAFDHPTLKSLISFVNGSPWGLVAASNIPHARWDIVGHVEAANYGAFTCDGFCADGPALQVHAVELRGVECLTICIKRLLASSLGSKVSQALTCERAMFSQGRVAFAPWRQVDFRGCCNWGLVRELEDITEYIAEVKHGSFGGIRSCCWLGVTRAHLSGRVRRVSECAAKSLLQNDPSRIWHVRFIVSSDQLTPLKRRVTRSAKRDGDAVPTSCALLTCF
ncbi:hypothetical protein AURANDRAFT_67483 [Aureococcus anophagefferens]|uniref:Carrier domain-containing protein n=1 Tax=Aureococcus anophagefferens TaxID=44056 RepID=F0YLB2_AURAN|nr:hypothetical protein AURANDRAFT_67483 [Aureococcus anophagefferens]EGB04109.1 hypothetical protein AURANDRAFT_67483 [Aureococcus anophagefferens]|eukprot:XP_009041234.1 hypothetical protein AURANDRAFT_67483 [Aureococcus anophagefferens]